MSTRERAQALLSVLDPEVVAELKRLVGNQPEPKPHLQTPGQTIGPPTRKWLKQAYLAEMKSVVMLARELGVSEKTVRKWLEQADIPMRSMSEAGLARSKRSGADENERLLDAIRDLAAKVGGRPAQSDWQTWSDRPCDVKGLGRRFGSWRDALVAAGFEKPGLGGPRRQNEQQLVAKREAFLDGLRAWAADHDGRAPTKGEWVHERPLGAYHDARPAGFTNWNEALRAAGLEPHPIGWRRTEAENGSTPAGKRPGRNRQMVTGEGLTDRLPGTVKHFGGDS